MPRGHAIKATAGDIKRVEHEKRVIAARAAKMAKAAQAEADKLSQVSVSIERATGEGDKLYGSVNSRDIAEALRAQGVIVDSKKIQLEEPIKALGLVEVPVKLGRGVTATIKVTVAKQGVTLRAARAKRELRHLRDRLCSRVHAHARRLLRMLEVVSSNSTAASRTPPHNIEAEKSVLGAVFIKPAAFDEVATNLAVDDFFLPAHREIFERWSRSTSAGRRSTSSRSPTS